ncbi:hypothetical protein TrVE_jg13431 [Triparma verrucosa]|nr:hypothetical protein TrST_g3968 [Triparma strigata]GMH96943.1 hypothetical protein TrVE_jg13431 [Triparma verrucosa]
MSIPKASPLPPNPTFADLTSPTWLQSRNKRSRPATLLQTLKTAAVALPTIALLGPVAFLSQSLLSRSRPKPTLPPQAPSELTSLPLPTSRSYDIALVGVTGFTGKLVLEYYLKTYPSLKIVVAGRDLKRVKSAVDAVKEICNSEKDIDMVQASASDWSSNFSVARSSKVVVTTAGPFAKIGNKLIEACAYSGTHYADITGETSWVRNNVKRLGGVAEEKGGVLCSLCGHDSVPWEFSVKGLETKLEGMGEDMVKVVLTDEIKSQASGGTIATMVDSVENPLANVKSDFDPIYGAKKGGKVVNASPKFVSKGPDGWMSFFMMSLVNAEAVKRSASLNQNLEYVEGERVDLLTGVNNTLSLYMSLCALYVPALRKFLMSKNIIPNPGTGPSLKQQQNGYLRVIGTGYGSKGSKVRSCIYFDSDPGYRDTARMVAEAGATLLEVGEKKEGGVYTPGAIIREEMTEKLLKGGTAFVVE